MNFITLGQMEWSVSARKINIFRRIFLIIRENLSVGNGYRPAVFSEMPMLTCFTFGPSPLMKIFSG